MQSGHSAMSASVYSRAMNLPDATRIDLPARKGLGGRDEPAITLSVHEAGTGPAVVFCHGFPEFAYSWRHQVSAVSAAGFRAIAPDQRGYGRSDRPEPIEQYDLGYLTGDLVGLLDQLGIEKAVFVGHDWGGFVAWAMPVIHPDRVSGVIGVNTPYVPFPGTKIMRGLSGGDDDRIYILWFQQPGVAEGVLDRNPRILFETLMRGSVDPAVAMAQAAASGTVDMNPFRRLEEIEPTGEAILSDEEIDTYTAAFERSGFRGGVNWYRNIDRNMSLVPGIGEASLSVPCLMVTAEWDPVLRPEMAAGMPPLIPDLETVMIEKCGHWTQQEKPEELNRILTDWLGRKIAE